MKPHAQVSLKPESHFPIDLRRKQRARQVGMLICSLGVPFCLASSLVDFYYGNRISGASEFIFFFGCFVSVAVTWIRDHSKPFFWVPAVLCLWLASIGGIGSTGGVMSPIFGLDMMLLFMAGVTFQFRFKLKTVAIATALNFVGWIIASALFHFQLTPTPVTTYFFGFKIGFIVIGLIICFLAFVWTEDEIVKDAYAQTEELTQAKNHLSQSAKMAEIGDLLAATAHELAQPIQVIYTSSSILQRMEQKKNTDLTIMGPIFQRMMDASARMVGLLDQLRDFSRNDPFELHMIDLRESVKSIYNLAKLDFEGKGIQFRFQTVDEPVQAYADSTRLQQVILNLVNNARDACVTSANPNVEMRIEKLKYFARITVKNTGSAIPNEIQGKIFDPYFTTKKRGKGTGLGLAICEQLVEQHKGRIFFSSEDEKTVFALDIPLTRGEHASTLSNSRPGMRTSSFSASGVSSANLESSRR